MGERTRELLILLVGDSIVFLLSLWVTLLVRYLAIPDQQLLADHFGPFLILSFFWLFTFYIGGLYDKHTVLLKTILFSRILNIQVVNIIIAGIFFIVVPFGIAPKTNLVIYLAVSVVLVTAWRLYLVPKLSKKTNKKAILLADGPDAIELADEINNNSRFDYTFVRLIDGETAKRVEDFPKKLMQLLEKEKIDIIVADPHLPFLEDVLPDLFDKAFLDFSFTFLDFYQVYEDTFDRIPLSALRYDWFLAHVSQSKSFVYDVSKRGIDIVGASVLGLIFIIILPFVVLAMRLEGKGDIFIHQDRLGQHNQPIRIYKLRTMTQNLSASATWTDEDAKQGNVVTRVGNFLRKTSIDEIPQVWSILKGDMSLIGPRNDIAGLGQRLADEIPYYKIRYFVKPGVTGWAQTHQRYQVGSISPQSIEESRMRFSYDLFYVKNRSLTIDLAIAMRTINTLLSRFGVTIRWPK